jgi:hypothetical protein
VNFAARLQSLAEPDSAFISEATHRLVRGLVDASFAGEHRIKGKSESQKVYRLDAIRRGATRFEAAVTRGLTVFVGREREMEILERGLAEASGQLRVIDVAAEPGMGKSRLLYEFRQRIERAFIHSGSCSPDGQQTPTPRDREGATLFKGCALVLLRQTEEGAKLLEGHRSRSVTYGYLDTLVASDPFIGVCKVLQGDIRGRIRFIEEAILKREKEGLRGSADWYRGILCDIYL